MSGQKEILKGQNKQGFNPMNDVAFKFIFGKDERKEITIDFLNTVLEKSLAHAIKDISFRQTEMIPDGDEGKLSRLDIACELDERQWKPKRYSWAIRTHTFAMSIGRLRLWITDPDYRLPQKKAKGVAKYGERNGAKAVFLV